MEQDHSKNEAGNNKENMKPQPDLILPDINVDPSGKLVYHKAIGIRAFWGGLAGGIIFALLFWLVASGYLPVTGLGQLSSAGSGAVSFFGFITGVAIGGLAGSVSGLSYMLKLESSRNKDHSV